MSQANNSTPVVIARFRRVTILWTAALAGLAGTAILVWWLLMPTGAPVSHDIVARLLFYGFALTFYYYAAKTIWVVAFHDCRAVWIDNGMICQQNGSTGKTACSDVVDIAMGKYLLGSRSYIYVTAIILKRRFGMETAIPIYYFAEPADVVIARLKKVCSL